MTNGQHVIDAALSYEGVTEQPPGSNMGHYINEWQHRWGMGAGTAIDPQPWCGMFADAMFAEAFVDDAGLCHPATAETCRRADDLGGLAPAGLVPPGSLIIVCGVHVGLVVRDREDGLLDTIEGNSGNGVRRQVRSKADWRIIVPPAIAADPTPAEPAYRASYGFDDLTLAPQLWGGWTTVKARDSQMTAYANAHPEQWVAPVKVNAPSPYAFRSGPAGSYGATWRFGGWRSKGTRNAQMAAYAERVGHHNLRTWRKSVPVPSY